MIIISCVLVLAQGRQGLGVARRCTQKATPPSFVRSLTLLRLSLSHVQHHVCTSAGA